MNPKKDCFDLTLSGFQLLLMILFTVSSYPTVAPTLEKGDELCGQKAFPSLPL